MNTFDKNYVLPTLMAASHIANAHGKGVMGFSPEEIEELTHSNMIEGLLRALVSVYNESESAKKVDQHCFSGDLILDPEDMERARFSHTAAFGSMMLFVGVSATKGECCFCGKPLEKTMANIGEEALAVWHEIQAAFEHLDLFQAKLESTNAQDTN